MSDYSKATEIFDSSFDSSLYFESIASEFTQGSLLKSIEAENIPLIFLLGEPGVGKTYMLNVLQNFLDPAKKVLFSSEPFSTPESFLHFLLEDEVVDNDANITELKEKVIVKFSNTNNIIILDEAQLINNIVLEFIRILSDTKHFTFLLSMHKNEGESIVHKSHFSSRNHVVVLLNILTKNEINKYIESQLLRSGLGNISQIFKKKQIKELQALSKGNFRVVKQLIKHSFSIMDYAKTHGHKKYSIPSLCVITMAGIDLGIIDV